MLRNSYLKASLIGDSKNLSNAVRSKLTLVDLFAGCGGLSLGLEMAGFLPVLVNELNSDAMDSYLTNRTQINPLLKPKYSVNDVKQLVLDDELRNSLIDGMKEDYGLDIRAGQLDLLVGGPPCQGYSGIGHRRSYSVDRKQLPSNHLYEDMAFLIREFKPKIFLFENVKGLQNARWSSDGEKGEIWRDVKSKFEDIPGYATQFSLVHAKDYGTPQNRPRLLLVGVREDLGHLLEPSEDAVTSGALPKPIGGAPDIIDVLGDLVDPQYKNGGETTKYPTDPMNELQSSFRLSPETGITACAGDELTEHKYSKHSKDILRKFRHMIKKGEIPKSMRTKKFAQRVLPEKWDKEPTITATSLPDDYVHFSQGRILTVREWARLQMFPDWYQFKGKRTTGGIRRAGNPRTGNFDRELPKYTQIGNAVPVSLARALGDHFVSLLSRNT
jgi:DNA (cytosine-5)-methyltransferase 1